MSSIQAAGMQTLRDNYRRVMDRIAAAALRSGRRPEDILMVAVTKTASPDQIRQLMEMGHADFGENRVQQLAQRVLALQEFLSRKKFLAGAGKKPGDLSPPQVRWHMIGHLQRNKAKQVVPLVKLIHSVDSLRLAEELHEISEHCESPIDVLLQINVTGEESKFGVSPPAAVHLAEQIDTMVGLRLRGLMTMAVYSDDPNSSRPAFSRCAEIFHEIRSAGIGGNTFNILSMGMTDDFEVAIEEGANIVRIGRALFGDEVVS